MKADDVKRPEELERENTRLKAIVADQASENRELRSDVDAIRIQPHPRKGRGADLRATATIAPPLRQQREAISRLLSGVDHEDLNFASELEALPA